MKDTEETSLLYRSCDWRLYVAFACYVHSVRGFMCCAMAR